MQRKSRAMEFNLNVKPESWGRRMDIIALKGCIHHVRHLSFFICSDKMAWQKQLREKAFALALTQSRGTVHHCGEVKAGTSASHITSTASHKHKIYACILPSPTSLFSACFLHSYIVFNSISGEWFYWKWVYLQISIKAINIILHKHVQRTV